MPQEFVHRQSLVLLVIEVLQCVDSQARKLSRLCRKYLLVLFLVADRARIVPPCARASR